MSDKLDLKQAFPRMYCGISSMRCEACDFEFVFVEPEEKESAMSSIADHIRQFHNSDFDGTPVIVTRH